MKDPRHSQVLTRVACGALAFTLPMLSLLAVGAYPSPVRAEGGPYDIRKTEPKLSLGSKAFASLTIAAKEGWHVNPDAPITVSLSSPSGLTIAKSKLTRADLVKSTSETAQFDIALQASAPGMKVLSAETKFVLCQASACKPVKETVTFSLEVAAPAKTK